MPRPRKSDARFDARGGVNSTYSEDLLDSTEVRRAYNARLTKHGSFVSRTGSRRLHSTALAAGAPIRGLVQWDAPAGRQIVAIAGGHLYHKLEGAAEFTQVASTFATNVVIQFERHRIGASIVLYIGDGATLRKWDGATLTTIAGAPAAADLAVYKGRLYGSDRTKRLHASAVSQPSVFDVPSGGFFGDVETFDTEGLMGLIVVGDSLLLAKEDNIARLTGVDTQEIQLDTETQGVSAEVGLAAPGTLVGLEGAAFGLSDRGPWIATESALELKIGEKVAAEFLGVNRQLLPLAVAVHHRRRKEIWVAIPTADATRNDAVWIFAYETGAWSGPWTDIDAASFARYERADGSEGLIAGGYDGFVREEDVDGSGLRDVRADGSGGTMAGMTIDFGAMTFGDPSRVKSIVGPQTIQADLGADGVAEIAWESEMGSGFLEIPTSGPGVRSYPYKQIGAKGRRLRLIVRTYGSTPTELVGFIPTVTLGAIGGELHSELVGAAATGVGLATADGTHPADGSVTGRGTLV